MENLSLILLAHCAFWMTLFAAMILHQEYKIFTAATRRSIEESFGRVENIFPKYRYVQESNLRR